MMMKTMMLITRKSTKDGEGRDVDVDKEDANHGDANEANDDDMYRVLRSWSVIQY